MKYCTNCGGLLIEGVPEGDTRARHMCPRCDTIHYQNPRIIAACIAEQDGKVLLCQRATEPRSGYWSFPAGFMELHETIAQAAMREAREEANAQIAELRLFGVINLLHIDVVNFTFRGNLLNKDVRAGGETASIRLVDEKDIQWNDLAFPETRLMLEHYLKERACGKFETHLLNVNETACV